VKRRIPIIADDTVDAASGTGAVKIAPAHETYDFEVGRRHKLQFISILNEDGTLNCNAGEKFKVTVSMSDFIGIDFFFPSF
jgi:valyl-tRNA synthetase